MIHEHHSTCLDNGHLFFASAALYRHRLGHVVQRRVAAATHRRARPRAHGGDRSIVTVIDPADGRSIGAAVDYATRTLHWPACHVEQTTDGDPSKPNLVLRDRPADVPVYGTSLAKLLTAALDADGDIDLPGDRPA